MIWIGVLVAILVVAATVFLTLRIYREGYNTGKKEVLDIIVFTMERSGESVIFQDRVISTAQNAKVEDYSQEWLFAQGLTEKDRRVE